MYLSQYISEVELGDNNKLSSLFNDSLKQVFRPYYIRRIDNALKKKIKLKETTHKNPNVIAYSVGRAIYINKNTFYNLDRKEQIKYLLHEFLHILQNNRRFLFFKGFNEINVLTNRLYKIAKEHLVKPFVIFLTGRNINVGPGGKHEIIAYLMNNSIDWSALDQKGKRLFKEEMRRPGIFNLQHQFWNKRLR